MSKEPRIGASCLTPILYVRNFGQAVQYYTRKLLFEKLWDWGKPPTFGAVRLSKIEIFFCLRGQGSPGTWLTIFLDDVDAYCAQIKRRGANVIYGPKNEPWGLREIHVRDPNGHVIRFGQGIPMREPKLKVRRVALKVRVEKRLAGLMGALARHKQMTVGEMLEEALLHSFEPVGDDGVASPHTKRTLEHIRELKKQHRLDYDCHASYRFVESSRRAGRSKPGK
jgi:catechol 2,3-dioxygenase-like lactoylglutathione lyase family enzyme